MYFSTVSNYYLEIARIYISNKRESYIERGSYIKRKNFIKKKNYIKRRSYIKRGNYIKTEFNYYNELSRARRDRFYY